ncbi:PepSY-associated TM helix domain-containing protein [Defluviimonas aestuarii]|uniref:PepSY-associated TM helix domain-containing protein n=1 Tax=Albidovulum aestuarii TaxID=1130726 RepID=UPI00249B0F4E|nr:PepSY-associated TM helix domain-containing protein [Defluviimonas aestuarii]MDI3337223.1 PepSY-associated TM helix domain-containing protein [Defluviimonas aestuarii]
MTVSDKPRSRINWHRLHSFFGLTVSLFLAFMFLSGTLLVFSAEIDQAFNPNRHVETAPGGKLSWGRIYDAAAESSPGWSIVRMIRSHNAGIADTVVMMNPEGKDGRAILVDPYRGSAIGPGGQFSFHDLMLQLHERLFVPGDKGRLLVTVFSLPLAAAVIAGIFSYRRFWTGFFRWPRRSGSSRAFYSDVHRLIGVWSLVFFVPLVLTSLWYFVELVGLGVRTEANFRTEKRQVLLPDGFDGAQVDASVKLATKALPRLQASEVRLPRMKFDPIVVMGQATAILVTERQNSVHIDPETLKVVGIQRAEDLSLHQRIAAAADPIHFGLWGGLTTKVLYTGFGIALTVLAIIGIVINAKRLSAMEAKRPTGPARSAFGRTWRAMGPYGLGAWMSVGLIAWGLGNVLYTLFFR